ncbi:nucleoside-diphosphate-sugar epimerase [Ilumatobacter fluminis]|uniref:Nucleoside-diphosphate-sugar epimerase n=1 Tax=Ilumatobacter fluminis TaxID=467091 RepID=A0A4R7I1X6_9ACTN|nr:NAD(P)-dependent oxidoreductase [Ilumatobacter fluminis]TDT16513.1 nucleoside-diphosphate-sugar epimerase [Ilumatobacter fluminis]
MSRSMRSVPDTTVVTGAGGWLGTALVHTLLDERSGTIVGLVTDGDEAARLGALDERIRPVVGDIRAPETLAPLFDAADGTTDVVHTAGVIHPTTFDDFDAVNHVGTRNVLDAARRADVRRFVHVSSNSPFGTNTHPTDRFRNDEPYAPYYGYGESKMRGELAVFDAVDAGLDAVIVRPPWFYGPHQPPRQTTFFRMVRTGRFPVFGDGRQRRSMSYVDNLAQGIVLAELVETEPGRAWWIADERPYEVREIVETVGRALADEGFDVSPNRFRVPDVVGRLAERADALIQSRGGYHQQIHVLGEMNKTIACDISAAQRDLGYAPEVDLYEGMRRSIRWCIAQGLEL